GWAFAGRVIAAGGRRVAVGYDGRLSSPALEAALVDGLIGGGVDVARIGRGPTPMLYFAVWRLDLDGGLMVTGSHNPPDHNGIKMMLGRRSFYGPDIQALGREADTLAAVASGGSPGVAPGVARVESLSQDYLDRLLQEAPDGGRPLAIGWDPGNGAAGDAVQALTAALPGRHPVINGDIDGRFPAHHPDPTVPANLVELQALVLDQGLEAGLAFDGDGDRLGVVDGQGRILWADQLLVLLAQDVLRHNPGAPIVADVKASQVLFDRIAAMGGKPVMARTGHSIIKSRMAELGAPLAGEMSGHIFFADRYYGYDDALYAAMRLLRILAASDMTLAVFHDSLPKVVNTPEIRVPVPAVRKFAIVEDVRTRLTAAGATLSDLDGVRVSTADGWWLLRASNTSEMLVARCEGPDTAALSRLVAALSDQLAKSGVARDTLDAVAESAGL
ncbi:MAG: phosphomannomutase/phosphoglucomutase, partial [Alphaproteobacteria bacterium]